MTTSGCRISTAAVVHILGPVPGFVGNVYVLARGRLLDPVRGGPARAACRRCGRQICAASRRPRPVADVARAPRWEVPRVRTQWCHGAPGIVSSLASIAPQSEELTELLLAGGELVWCAGPLVKGPGPLSRHRGERATGVPKLFERTGDELWLDRAREFAMHALEQVERMRGTYGRGRYTLWTGDPGTALYLHSCLTATAAFPTLDHF